MSTRFQLTVNDGDTLMVCKHIYGKSSCRIVQKLTVLENELRKGGAARALNPRVSFTRADGSLTPLVSATVSCAACLACDPREVDYVEQRWHGGRLLVADFSGVPVER